MARLNPVQFLREVRQEASKVSWPAWKEVWVTTLMVLVMVVIASLFFTVADIIIAQAVNLILRQGG